MLIIWDDRKNVDNFKKHRVWFEEAQTVITNPLSLMASNNHPDGARMEYLGWSIESNLLYVVTKKQSDEVIRIISARFATKNEKVKYEEGI
jgi:uncharacterized DUF497 family protein